MGRNKGKRHDDYGTRKLNVKKVIATIIAIIVIIMIFISLKNLLTNNKNKDDFSTTTSYISALKDNKWGVIDNNGNTVISFIYDEMIIIPDESKDIFICSYDIDYNNETYKTKVLNKDGKEIFSEYENIRPVENNDGSNIWYETNSLIFSKDGKYGLIDFEEKILTEPEYDNIYSLQGIDNSLIIEKDGLKGLLNPKTSEIIIKPQYTEITSVSDSYENGYIVKNTDNKFGLILPNKKEILEEKYDEIKKVASKQYYVVVENGVQEIVNNSGKVILNSGFDTVEDIQVNKFVVTIGGNYGVIDNSGKTVINPEYQNLKFATSNQIIAQKEGKYGIINHQGDQEIDFKYDRISFIDVADFFLAENSDATTDIINSNMEVVLTAVYISDLNTDDGYLRVRQGDDYKYYNFRFEEKTNKELLAGNTLFLVKENGKYGYVNKKGEKIVDCIYDDATEQNKFGYCAVKQDGLWGALKYDGTVVVKPSRDLNDYLYIDFISEWNRCKDLSINAYTK